MPASARRRRPSRCAPEQLQVAIIGAGATGTELAAELHKTTRQLVAYGFDRIDPDKDIKIHLIEAAPRILPALPERLSEAAAKLLRGAEGARAHVGARDAEVLPNGREAGQRRRRFPPSWWCGRPASRRPISCATSTAWRPTA